MKIVVLDGYTENPGDLSWENLEVFGELTIYDRTAYTESKIIAERIGDAQIAVINKTPISASTMDACKKLKLICVLATGYNVVDCKAAKERGICVCNVPSYGTEIVAQYAVSLLMEICSHIGHHSETVKNGRWQKEKDFCYWDFPMMELSGKTAGIIGVGRIGRTTARILHGFGMKVLGYDHHFTDEKKLYAEESDLNRIYSESDVIFLHCPSLPETNQMINKESIDKMKDGVILINNSRGQLINENDLAYALNSGKVYAAGLDVVSTEPISEDNPLLSAKNCIITPHISWAAKEARQRIMDITADNIREYICGTPINVVNT